MYIADCTSDIFEEKVEKIKIAVMPVGSVEAHGHHLPLGTDCFSPELFCKMLENKIGDQIWIAPGIHYGQCLDMSIYGGTITVPSAVLAEYIYHIGKSMHENGIEKLIFLNGHGGNVTALNLASEKLVQLGMDVLTINWWLDFSKDILKITSGQGHAGEDETSAILYYNEKLVDMSRASKNCKKLLYRVYFKERGKTIYANALSGDATPATKQKGQKIFEVLTDRIVDVIKDIKSGKYYIEE